MAERNWFEEHAEYLATIEWDAKRRSVLERDRSRCQAGLPGCNGEATQAHHLTYKHWRNEPLFDLISVCIPCHDAITEMDRGNRPPASRLRQRPGIRIDIP